MSIRNILAVLSILFFFSGMNLQVFSQTPTPTPAKEQKWIRVQSENGEFSIDVPDDYDYFFDEKGFSVSNDTTDYPLKDINIFNSYRNGVLLSFESYQTSNTKDALKALMEVETHHEKKTEKVKAGDKIFYQTVIRNEKYYLIRQYFITKEYVYILTAASRKEGAQEIDRFLKSRTILGYPSPSVNSALPIISMSALKISPMVLDVDNAEDGRARSRKKTPPKSPQAVLPQPEGDKFVVLIKPRASYITPARQAGEEGDITLKISFTTKGGISRIEVVRTLGNGLLRQTALTALRLKYLPKEENGAPIAVTKTIVYGFSIY